jgi:hypothetical protein
LTLLSLNVVYIVAISLNFEEKFQYTITKSVVRLFSVGVYILLTLFFKDQIALVVKSHTESESAIEMVIDFHYHVMGY